MHKICAIMLNPKDKQLDKKVKNLIGIRREDKNEWERRTPLIPSHARELIQKHSLEIRIQSSSIRIFSDKDYELEGSKVQEDLSACPVIFSIKEIPAHLLERGKTYVFFSHTIKGQPHNMPLLKKMIELECTLIDYETILDEKDRRLLFFGKQAGQAGMIDTLWAFGQRLMHQKRTSPFSLIQQAYRYKSLFEAKEEIGRIGWKIHNKGLDPALVPLVCGFTGYGHVSQGAQEIFNLLPVEDIRPEKIDDFFTEKQYTTNRVYKVVFEEKHMVEPVSSDQKFELQDYYDHPQKYRPVFESYLPVLNILVNCIFWSPEYPRFVTKKFLEHLWQSPSLPRLRVIGDISCDVEGSVECTIRSTDPGNPVFVYNPVEDRIADGFEGKGVVVMAIDNLPAEIPLESSIFFSQALKPFIPAIAKADYSGDFADCDLPNPIKNAVILYCGQFTPDYLYMENFIK